MTDGTITAGRFSVSMLHTPGHSAGSACLLVDGVCFAGDTIFKGMIGRAVPTGAEGSGFGSGGAEAAGFAVATGGGVDGGVAGCGFSFSAGAESACRRLA